MTKSTRSSAVLQRDRAMRHATQNLVLQPVHNCVWKISFEEACNSSSWRTSRSFKAWLPESPLFDRPYM